MSRSILCARSRCNGEFRPKGNQQYCSPKCQVEARKVQNRRSQRKHRYQLFLDRCQKFLETNPPPERVSAIRAGPTKFAYHCDNCHSPVLRPARQLSVFCCKSCRLAFRRSRRRLVRRFLKRRWPRLDTSGQPVDSRGPQIFPSPQAGKIRRL
jgi:hypothetical protein